ncbi:phospholipid-binding protein [Filimonas lacunae]|nr:phospholipid-binding protein [Filimonas lacunae]
MLLLVLLGFQAMSKAQTFTLKSNDLGGQFTHKQLFNSFGYSGENVSPQLSWENAPAGTQYFAITMYDKDAPTGSGFWHWVVFNIPASTSSVPANAGNITKNLMPAGAVQGVTDYGVAGYGGPAPPAGAAHQYLFTVYALKSRLDLNANTSPAMVGFYLNSLVLAKASIVAYAQHP